MSSKPPPRTPDAAPPASAVDGRVTAQDIPVGDFTVHACNPNSCADGADNIASVTSNPPTN
jgi:hypothetical protein